ncbi:MAG: hypothetical protein HQL31_09520 [Planctomycetes bacterium]|nr:hypothetical protein [Planctomycetota bacterium]
MAPQKISIHISKVYAVEYKSILVSSGSTDIGTHVLLDGHVLVIQVD